MFSLPRSLALSQSKKRQVGGGSRAVGSRKRVDKGFLQIPSKVMGRIGDKGQIEWKPRLMLLLSWTI